MPKGYPKMLYQEMYEAVEEEKKEEWDMYLVCPFCGEKDKEQYGHNAITTWCIKCGKAFDAIWKVWKDQKWVSVSEL